MISNGRYSFPGDSDLKSSPFPLSPDCGLDLTTAESDFSSGKGPVFMDNSMNLGLDDYGQEPDLSPRKGWKRKGEEYRSADFAVWKRENSAGFQESVRLSFDLKAEREKVDTLQALLVQRETQKEAFYLQSVKKDRECLALREQVLNLQGTIHAQEQTHKSSIKNMDSEIASWQTKAQNLAAENDELQRVSSLLETHALQLRESVADLEAEKLALMKAKTALEAELAAGQVPRKRDIKENAPEKRPESVLPTTEPGISLPETLEIEQISTFQKRVSVQDIPKTVNFNWSLFYGVLLALVLGLTILGEGLRTKLAIC